MTASQERNIHILHENDNKITIDGKEFSTYSWDEVLKHKAYIYITVNKINHMLYLGLVYSDKKKESYLGSGKHIKSAIKKYGEDNFNKYIIDFSESKEGVEDLEVYYICKHFGYDIAKDTGWYNITSGRQRGGNSWAGYTTEEHKARANKIKLGRQGYKASVETRVKMSKAVKHRFSNPKARTKTSIATKKAMNSLENSQKLIPYAELPIVVRGKEYYTFSAIGRDYNFTSSSIRARYLKGKRGEELVKHIDLHSRERWGHFENTVNKIKDDMTYAQKYIVVIKGKSYVFITGSIPRLALLIRKYVGVQIGKNVLREIHKHVREHYNGVESVTTVEISDQERLLYACSYLNGNNGVYKGEVVS